MQNLTYSQFIAKLNAHAGAAIVGLNAHTDTKALKTNNPFPNAQIFKRVRAVGFVGADYEKSVQREGERQGADASGFVADKLPWGQWHLPGKVIEHKLPVP